MAEFKLGRIRFVWQGTWSAATSYLVDDVVQQGGKSYICVINHTSSSAFDTDFSDNPPKWNLVSDGVSWRGNWTATTYYNAGDLVKFGGIVYQCNTPHTSATFVSPTWLGLENDQSKWDTFATSFNWTAAWATNTRYKVNDFVTYGGYTYVCKTKHISNASAASGLEADQSKWDIFNAGVTYLGAWSSAVRYKLNDVVKYGADLWICTTQHTSAGTTIDTAKFSVFVNGFQFENSWNNSTQYQIGDTVTYGGVSYIAKTNNLNSQPTTNVSDWDPFTTGFNFRSDWDSSTAYKIGDLVRLHGYTYVAIADSTNYVPPNVTYWTRLQSGLQWINNPQTYNTVTTTNVTGTGTSATFNVTRSGTVYSVTRASGGSGYANGNVIKVLGSNLGGISPANDLIITVTGVTTGAINSNGFTWSGTSVSWTSGTAYVLGDVVLFGANSYICILGHTGNSGNRPDADTTATYWNLLAAGAEVATLTTAGDTFYYGPNGPSRLPAGTDGQILRVSSTGYPTWSYYGLINNLVYVGPSGVDSPAPSYGLSIDKPWKSVRYAAKQIEEGYQNPQAKMLLQMNKQFLLKEINNYVSYTYQVIVASASSSNNQFTTTSSTSVLSVNMPISFNGTTGGVTNGQTYYVKSIVDATHFTITATPSGATANLTTGSTPMTGVFVYDAAKTERDAGYIVDAIIFDISHGGNSKTTAATLAYYNALGNGYITAGTGYEISQFIGAQTYLKTLVNLVLTNTGPSQSYQTLNSVASPAYQIINLAYTAETGVTGIAQALSDIVINGLSAGTATAVATALQPNTTISVKTGTYTEILPIVVPANTAIVGDELRGTVVQPASANPILVNDKPKSISALRRIKSLIPSIVSNSTVVPTTGNAQSQQYVYTGLNSTATTRVDGLVTAMVGILSSTAATPVQTYPDPTGLGSGFSNARRLIVANKQFIKDEVTAYMVANYSALWTSLGTTGQASCTRDIGYILDGIAYDLTYGETSGCNLATVISARSYYSNGTFVEASNEKTAALAVQARIKVIITQIAQAQTVTRTSGNTTTQDVTGTAGSSTAGTFAQARIQEVYDTINTGSTPATISPSLAWVTSLNSSLTTANTAIQAAKAGIQANLIQWINKTYPTLVYNTTTCSRDAGYIIDALCYDMMFNSNFLSVWTATSYFRAISSAQLVLASQLQPTLATIGFISASVKELTGSTVGSVGSLIASTNVVSSSNVIYDIVNSGSGTEPSFVLPTPTGYNTSYLVGYGDGRGQVAQNYAFIKADISQYLSNNYNSLWTSLGATGQANCQRDIGYILDALQYDMTYGGNFQTLIAGSSYYSNYVSTIASTERTAILAAYALLKTNISTIVQNNAVTAQSGNLTTQVRTGTQNNGATVAATFAQARIQDIIDWITNGYAPATSNPSITWTSTSLQTSFAALQSARGEIQSDTVAWVKKYYQTMYFNSVTCSRDAGLIVDALSYDMVFGSNFNAITAGRSYLRATTSAQVVYSGQKAAELGAINFIKNKARMIVAAGGVAQASQAIDDITQYITNGATPRLNWPNPSNINSGYAAAAVLLQDNKEFIKAEISAYMALNYSSVWTAIVQASCTRDVGYILDALTYDLKYGGNSASVQAAKAYYSYTTLEIAAGEKAAMLASLTQISTVAQAVVQDNAVSVTSGNYVAQVRKNAAQTAGSGASATALGALVTTMYNIVNSGLTAGVPTITITTIAGTNTFTTGSAHGLSVNDIVIPQSTANGLVSGTAYYVSSTPLGTTFTLSATYNGATLATFTNGTGLSIVAEKTNLPVTSQVDATLIAQAAALSSAKSTIQTAITTYIATYFSTVVYNSATCLRDVGYFVDAVMYDMMLNSNYRIAKAGMSYYTAQAALVVGAQKDATVNSYRYMKTLMANVVASNTTASSRVKSLMNTAIAIIINGLGETPEIHGTNSYNNTLGTIKAVEALRANKTFLSYEATAWISANYGGTITYTSSSGNTINTTAAHNLSIGDPVRMTANTITTSATATNATGNLITVGDTTGFVIGMPITFTGTGFGGVQTNQVYYIKSIPNTGIGGTITISTTNASGVVGSVFTVTTATGALTASAGGLFGGLSTVDNNGNTVTYYVLTVPSSTSFTVTATQGSATPVTLTSASGVATATYAYAPASCRRDMAEYIEALIYDMQFVGNYKALRAAKLYNNAVSGSLSSDFYLVRNGTGIRNQTMTGLTGYLTEVNDYGTKRPTAGAYTSLDPGFGPNDQNVWITTRSCYTQNCTMFGTACSGMKIDAALHTGGNKSIVANDYTTIISDGIGVWCTGSGSLTELVSVFNYYGYAGYFAELGGRMRATNGNSSYGTYGVIAEGVDTYETPIYGTVNNRGNPAQITNVVTDAVDKILRFEFSNAGNNYTNYVPTISGAGYNATAIGDEFRDSSIFETRIIDLNDSNGYGGSNYLTAANAAQTGDPISITLAASDQNLSTAYPGMRVQVVGGTGVGQYANILAYNNGSKIAQVYKDSVAPYTITATTQGTPSTVTVASTAQLYANMPFYVGTTVGGLTTGTPYYVAAVLSTTTFSVATSSGGTALTTAITTTTGQSVTMYAAGWDHVIPGTTVANALDLTTSYVVEPRINYTAPGFRATAKTLSASTTWNSVAYGQSKFVAITSNGTTTSTSADGKTWTAGGNLSASTTYADVVYIGGQGASAYAVVGGLGGQGAVLTAVLGVANTTGAALADQVASVTVVNGGYGYTTPPTIVFTSGTGSGATATCTVLNGAIQTVTIVIPGSGYATAPTVTAATDRVTSIVVSSYGKNYTSAPTVTLTGGGSSNQATATASLSNNGVGSIAVGNNGGSGYTSAPTVTILDSLSRFVAVPTTATNASYAVPTAVASTWTASTTALPTGSYASAAYGGGYVIAVGGTASASRSLDGSTWTGAGTIPTTTGTYSSITYGNGVFVAITTGAQATAWTANGNTWTAGGNLPSSTTWTSVAYGNGRFVAIASGGRSVAYSLDNAVSWKLSPAGLPSSQTWSKVVYGQGVFLAIAQGTTVCATSPDGVLWTERAMPSSTNWKGAAFGNPSNVPVFAAVSLTSGTTAAAVVAGAQATGRIKITSNAVSEVRMIEPGSNYPKGAITAIASSNVINTGDTTNLVDSQPIEFTGLDSYGLTTNITYYVIGSTIVTDTSFKVSATAGSSTAVTLTTGTVAGTYRAGPIVTQYDPNKVKTAPLRVRNGDGAMANPSFNNRGTGNTTATASVTGDGYGDLYQPSNFINVAGLFDAPQPGANVEFSTIPGTWYKLVAVTNKLGVAGNYTATFQVNPAISVYQAPAHNVQVTTRLKYSQVRLTGHDFLYIGTGNKTQTNYPNVNASTASIANQALASGGGRVFFTSTDQDGNFNVGNLFGVQQSTGTATLNASAFNLSGLQSLSLGSVSVGTSSATITQFSTDPYFTANSDNILPTQRAIKSYITAQIGGGQSSLNVNTLTSGVIYVANNTISTTTGVQINVKSKMTFSGGIDGAPVALGYFLTK